MTAKTYYVARPSGTVGERVRSAVATFVAARGVPPVRLAVHAREAEAARAAVAALGLALAVDARGGCLIPEIWMA